jgi:hypothetical protein
VWGMVIWGGWAEATYKRMKSDHRAWYWLDVFKIERSPENCIRLLKGVSLLGVVLVLAGLAAHGGLRG